MSFKYRFLFFWFFFFEISHLLVGTEMILCIESYLIQSFMDHLIFVVKNNIE